MANLINEGLGKLNGESRDFAGRMAGGAENQIDKMSHQVGAKLGTLASGIATATTQNVKKSREYVLEHPAKSIAMAAAAGAVAGSILTMAMRRSRRH